MGNGHVLLCNSIISHSNRTDVHNELGIKDIPALDNPQDYTDIGNVSSTVLCVVVNDLLQIPFVISVILAVVSHKGNDYSHVGDRARFRVEHDTSICAFGVDRGKDVVPLPFEANLL